jgi:coproporphyrinogen III oxidase-like Fe-S oxidoreductase
MLDENISAEFYETTNQITKENGFDCYEISNYCKKDFSCKTFEWVAVSRTFDLPYRRV